MTTSIGNMADYLIAEADKRNSISGFSNPTYTFEIKIGDSFSIMCTGTPPTEAQVEMYRLAFGWKVIVL